MSMPSRSAFPLFAVASKTMKVKGRDRKRPMNKSITTLSQHVVKPGESFYRAN